jgi:rubredoxin
MGLKSQIIHIQDIYFKIQIRRSKNMAKWECMICGYIYDEEVEGTKFEDLPEDWVCPDCGAPKEDFEEVD